jgi:N-acetylmuramic acid 6-phosphate etherase
MPGGTEARHDQAEGLDRLPAERVLDVIHETQIRAIGSVKAAIPAISEAAEVTAQALKTGGRLIYVGAGSSGLMALADGLELPGTFGLAGEDVNILLAGGVSSHSSLAGAPEDDEALALADIEMSAVGANDCVICVTASGSTPYTVAAARAGRARGARVIGIANVVQAPLFAACTVSILLETPPEVIAGSTRMGAGTAQKVALNMLSTLTAIHLGHVYDGYMINLKADNAKLQARAMRIVREIADVSQEAAARSLSATGGSVKLATLVASGAGSLEEASRLLDSHQGDFRSALQKARAGQ